MARFPRPGEIAESMNRRPRLWLAMFALLLAVQISPWWYPTDDGATYLSLGRCVAEGRPLASLGRSGLGVPPGYSLLIAPLFLISDRPFLGISILHWALAVALMIGVHRWARRHAPEAAVVIAGLVVLNAAVWIHYRRTLKEIAFLTAIVWSAEALESLVRAAGWRQLAARLPLAGLLFIAVVLIRYSGGVLFAGFAAAVLLRLWRHETRRGQAVAILAALGAAAAASAMLLVWYGGTVYLQGFVDPSTGLADRLSEGMRLRISDVGRVSIAGMFKSYSDDGWLDANMLAYLPACALIAAGWWRLGWGRQDVLALTFPFYFALYVAWPFGQSSRFMLPMLPALFACAWFGLGRYPRWRPGLFALSLAAHFATSFGYWVAVDARRAVAGDAYWGPIDGFAAEIGPEDRESVEIRGLPSRVRSMFDLALDRRTVQPAWSSAAEVRWIVQPEGSPAPAGFVVRRSDGELALLCRQSAAAALPPPAPPEVKAPVFADATPPEGRKVVQ